jgi:hypothetical protein
MRRAILLGSEGAPIWRRPAIIAKCRISAMRLRDGERGEKEDRRDGAFDCLVAIM